MQPLILREINDQVNDFLRVEHISEAQRASTRQRTGASSPCCPPPLARLAVFPMLAFPLLYPTCLTPTSTSPHINVYAALHCAIRHLPVIPVVLPTVARAAPAPTPLSRRPPRLLSRVSALLPLSASLIRAWREKKMLEPAPYALYTPHQRPWLFVLPLEAPESALRPSVMRDMWWIVG
jgi:hypothetical protein